MQREIRTQGVLLAKNAQIKHREGKTPCSSAVEPVLLLQEPEPGAELSGRDQPKGKPALMKGGHFFALRGLPAHQPLPKAGAREGPAGYRRQLCRQTRETGIVFF